MRLPLLALRISASIIGLLSGAAGAASRGGKCFGCIDADYGPVRLLSGCPEASHEQCSWWLADVLVGGHCMVDRPAQSQ